MPHLGALALLALLPASAAGEPPGLLVSRPLAVREGLAVGDRVTLANEPSAGTGREFRVVGIYEPMADPMRLGSERLEIRLHLPDLAAMGDHRSAAVSAVNAGFPAGADAKKAARALAARLPGLLVRPTRPGPDAADPFVVLDRFHVAIAGVTVVASSIFLLALMVMLVDERRESVAVLRLIGLGRRRILAQLFVEGLLLAAAGALFGVVLAAVLQEAFNRFFQWRYDTALVFVRVTAPIALRSVLLAVPLGVLAALASSWGLLRRDILSGRR